MATVKAVLEHNCDTWRMVIGVNKYFSFILLDLNDHVQQEDYRIYLVQAFVWFRGFWSKIFHGKRLEFLIQSMTYRIDIH